MSVPPTGNFKVLVLGALANTVVLGGYSSGQNGNGAANNVTAYAGIKSAIQAVNPAAQVDFLRGFTGTSTSASSCCTTIDPTAVTAAAGYDYVIVYTGIDSGVAAEDRGPRPHGDHADGPAGPADRAGRGRQPEHDRRDAGDPPATSRRSSRRPRRSCGARTTASARARLWRTSCSARTTRAGACPRPSTRASTSSRRRQLRHPPGRRHRPHLHVLQRPGLLPVRVRPELHDVRLLEPDVSQPQPDRRRHDPRQRRRHQHGLAWTATRSSRCT